MLGDVVDHLAVQINGAAVFEGLDVLSARLAIAHVDFV